MKASGMTIMPMLHLIKKMMQNQIVKYSWDRIEFLKRNVT